MKTRRLTKKYKSKRNSKNRKSMKRKNKSRSKSISRSKSRKRILKGGTIEEQKKIFLTNFFDNLQLYKFPEALCALHNFYTCGITPDEINEFLSSPDFKHRYDNMFFRSVQVPDIAGNVQTNMLAKERLIFFLSYIFKKIAEGQNIECSPSVYLQFTLGPNSFLKILKKFFGYLDTACVLTISYQISQATFNEIALSPYAKNGNKDDKPNRVSNGQLALYDLVTSLTRLAKYNPVDSEESKKRRRTFSEINGTFSEINDLLALMTTGDGEGRVYSFNTGNMCTLIKMIQRVFTYFDEPDESEPKNRKHAELEP
jgi:hypothetical protein